MPRELKVYGGRFWYKGAQCRAIVAARTKKKVTELTGISMNELNTYWSVTRNDEDISIALEKPETVFITKDEYRTIRVYKELKDETD